MRMNVAFSSSEAYSNITYLSILSLFENHKHIENIVVYLVEEKICLSTKDRFLSLADKYNRTIKFIPLDEVIGENEDVLPTWGGSRNLCYKLFLSSCEAFNDVDTLLCLESDMFICDDISDVFQSDLTEKYVVGVGNPINCYKSIEPYSDERPMYLNGGLNLFNLDLMRKKNVQKNIVEFILANANCKATTLCERVYNILFADKIGYLPARYNVSPYMLYFSANTIAAYKNNPYSHTQAEIDEARSFPAIVHFAGGLQYVRPWFSNSDHPMKEVFLRINDLSDWKKDVTKPYIKSKSMRKRKAKHFILKLLPVWIVKIIAKYV